MDSIHLLDIKPFETGRFKREFENVELKMEWTSPYMDSHQHYEDYIVGNKTVLSSGRITYEVLLSTTYEAILEEKSVYITEYRRFISRKIDHKKYKEDPQGVIEEFGQESMNVINDLVQKYPLSINFKFWIELYENKNKTFPVNHFEGFEFYPENWDSSVAAEVPLLALYVVDEVNPIKEDNYVRQFTNLTYGTRRRLFIEELKMTYILLLNEVFAELVFPDNFLIRENFNKSSEVSLSCVASPSCLFMLISSYIYNYKSRSMKKKSLKTSKKKLHLDSLHDMFGETMCILLMELFELEYNREPGSAKDKREDLPPEMFMLYSRLNERSVALTEKELKNMIEELEYANTDSKIMCFNKLKFLGSSTYGDVHLAEHKGSKMKYAIKIIRNYKYKTDVEVERLLETLLLLVQLDNVHLMRYYDAWTTDQHCNWIVHETERDWTTLLSNSKNDSSGMTFSSTTKCLNEIANTDYKPNWNPQHSYTFVVLEACETSLATKMKESSLTEAKCVKYMKQFIEGMEYLNVIGFMHRDVKPGNALINKKGNLLLSDLDTLQRIKDSTKEAKGPMTVAGTPVYVSPEMLTRVYNERTDYFSIGVSFAQMMFPKESEDMKKFLELIHAEELPTTMHPQYTFLIRWLTENDPKERIGFLSFSILLSLLQKHKYNKWPCFARSSYYVILESLATGCALKCIRVANKNKAIREVVKRYTRRPNSFVLCNDIRLRIEPKFAFESNYNMTFNDTTQKLIDLKDNRLTLVPITDDYIYVCYSVEEYEDAITKPADFDYWVKCMFAAYIDTMTRWGNYCCSTINRAYSKDSHFVIEPCLLDDLTIEEAPSEITLFWPPEKFNNSEPMTESGAIYAFGLFLLWNLLRNLDVTEDDIVIIIRELREGKRPMLPEELEPYLVQYILLICTYDPQMRPTAQNLPQQLTTITRDCVIDDVFPFRLCLAYKDHMESNSILGSSDSIQQKEYNANRKLNQYIYTVANRADVTAKFFKKLKSSGRFKILPRLLAKEGGSSELIEAKCMLDFDKNGLLTALPRNEDAVDWLVIEFGDSYPEIRKNILALKEVELSYIYSTFVAALKELAKCYRIGLCHGNISLDTFLLCNTNDFCISNPILIETNNQFFNRNAYNTEYTSPEQLSSGTPSHYSDIYSLGVTLYSCLCIYYDLPEGSVTDVFRSSDRTSFPEKIPAEFVELINQMTNINPLLRNDCETALRHFVTICEPYLVEVRIPSQRLVINDVVKDDNQLEVAI